MTKSNNLEQIVCSFLSHIIKTLYWHKNWHSLRRQLLWNLLSIKNFINVIIILFIYLFILYNNYLWYFYVYIFYIDIKGILNIFFNVLQILDNYAFYISIYLIGTVFALALILLLLNDNRIIITLLYFININYHSYYNNDI